MKETSSNDRHVAQDALVTRFCQGKDIERGLRCGTKKNNYSVGTSGLFRVHL